MIPLVAISNHVSHALPEPSAIAALSILYEMAHAIFRIIAMAVQYATVRLCLTVRHWCWFSSALKQQNIYMSSRNFANLEGLQKCFVTAWHPDLKVVYEEMGRTQGLRITHDIVYHPASGICLGKSMTFLSQYVLAEGTDDIANLLLAAQAVEGKSNEMCVKLQAIYDGLMGIQGRVQSQERDFFCKVLQRKNPVLPFIHHQELLSSIEAFLDLEDQPETLRHFVLDQIENQGIDLSTDLYALILELDTIWSYQQHPGIKKNDSVHNAIVQTMANYVGLELIEALRLGGKISCVLTQLEALDTGSYLIHFNNHTIACVKIQDGLALFDPSEGLALLKGTEQHEGLSQLLKYYASNEMISLNIVAIEVKDI